MSKPLAIGPLTGVLDLRSEPDELPRDALRMRQNLRTVGQGKLRRGNGFEKLLSTGTYNNSDFHDQLLALTAGVRQPVTLLFEAESTRKIRSLFVATQGTIAQLNTHTGNYRIYGKGFGGTPSTSASAPRFKAAALGDYVAFTNDFDRVKYAVLEQAADPDSGQLLYEIPDLDTIGLTRAAVIWQWRNVLFLANVEMDGERWGNRFVWSDFNDPTAFDPANLASITGYRDLYDYETILAGLDFGDTFLIYTTHGIWEMAAVGGDQSFDVRRVYDGEKDKLQAVLAYPNTLVSLHDAHAYMANDGVYFFTQYARAPQRPEWLHRSTADLYQNLDSANCQAHVGAIYGEEVLWSVARLGAANGCPDYTLRVNKTYKVSDVMDAGFSAFCQFSPMDLETIRDFIVENAICTLDGLKAAGYGYGTEGLPRVLPSVTAPFIPNAFYQTATQTISDGFGGTLTVEDWTQPNASAQSLCALLAGARLDEICRQCKGAPLLVAASSADWCLKQLTDVYYRERCVNPAAVGSSGTYGYSAAVGSYALDPITSILRFAPVTAMDSKVMSEQLEVKFKAKPQSPPLQVGLRIGISAQPADPNTGEGMVWFQHSSQPLNYQTAKTEAQHLADNTIPFERAHWHFFREGRFLYFELTIAGVGGDALFGSIEAIIKNLGETINY